MTRISSGAVAGKPEGWEGCATQEPLARRCGVKPSGLPPGLCPACVRVCLGSRDRREERRLESRRQNEILPHKRRGPLRARCYHATG